MITDSSGPLFEAVFVSWQRTREAIGRVEVSQPAQMSSAMSELIDARAAMEVAVREMMRYALCANRPL